MILLNRATNEAGAAAQLGHVAEHASEVRVVILLTLLSCFSAIVLAVTLYGLTRDEDHERPARTSGPVGGVCPDERDRAPVEQEGVMASRAVACLNASPPLLTPSGRGPI
jgi:hypothetical protein